MKEIDPDIEAEPRDDADPWVEQGLRALREQLPSDESRRATLAQLGIADEAAVPNPVVRGPAARGPAASRALLRWLLGGALLGVLGLLLQRWLG